MKKITWVSFIWKRSGGYWYGKVARKVISPFFETEFEDFYFENIRSGLLRPLFWVFRLISLWFRKPKDLWIFDDIAAALVPFLTRKKRILVIYHIDFSVRPLWQRIAFKILEPYLYWNIRQLDGVVVISRYWEKHFKDRGCKNVYRIYCSFPMEEYQITDQEVEQFKEEFGIKDKPIVYIGNCQKEKGVVEAYEALKDLPVHLVTSGKRLVEIPALNLDLDRRNFLRLLKASDLGVFMTRFRTGWDLTACEMMLFKKPIIGRSIAAMRELLESSGQIICDDPKFLKEKVIYLLSHPEERKKQGERGYEFVKQFDLEYFKKRWISVIDDVLGL